jgi:hypothetical protein
VPSAELVPSAEREPLAELEPSAEREPLVLQARFCVYSVLEGFCRDL